MLNGTHLLWEVRERKPLQRGAVGKQNVLVCERHNTVILGEVNTRRFESRSRTALMEGAPLRWGKTTIAKSRPTFLSAQGGKVPGRGILGCP